MTAVSRRPQPVTAEYPLEGEPPAGFSVRLDNFTGPFDLLLQLISRHKLDITEVALSRVTDEFIAHIKTLGPEWDLEQTSQFVVVAATLLDLKAARLLPAGDVEDPEDLALLEARDLTDRVQPHGVQLLRRDRPDAPQPLDRQGVQEPQLVLDGYDEQPVGLAQGAGHLGEVLRAGDADRDGQPDPGAYVVAEPLRDDRRGAPDAPQASDLEEGLVDGDALDDRRGVVEDVEDVATGLGVRVHAR